MYRATPAGITPPAPGLEREEPEFMVEDDIPSDDDGPAARTERRERSDGSDGSGREERPQGKIERE